MNYAARLARLERLVGKGAANCPYCRLFVRHTWIDPKKTAPGRAAPSPAVHRKCELCGGNLRYGLAEYAEEERELARLALTAQLEDFYADRRTYAAWRWNMERSDALEARKEQRRERERRGQPHVFQGAHRRDRKDGPGEKLYDKLNAECSAAIQRIHRRLAARYGEEPFPELVARFDAIKHVDRRHLCEEQGVWWRVPTGEMMALEREEKAWLRCAEAERFVLGEALARTLERAADCDRRAVAMIEEARRKYEEEKAERERRHREFLEEGRRLLEKKLAAAPPPAAPVVTPPVATVQHRPANMPAVTNAPAPRPPAKQQPSIFLPVAPAISRRRGRPRRR